MTHPEPQMSNLWRSRVHVCINSITWSNFFFRKWINFDPPGLSNNIGFIIAVNWQKRLRWITITGLLHYPNLWYRIMFILPNKFDIMALLQIYSERSKVKLSPTPNFSEQGQLCCKFKSRTCIPLPISVFSVPTNLGPNFDPNPGLTYQACGQWLFCLLFTCL